VFDTTTVNANSKGFNGAVFDGRYVYLVPYNNGAFYGQVTRYDTTGSFTAAGSYSVFDTTTVNANSKGFIGAVFDGRYVYLVPYSNGVSFGQVTRIKGYAGGIDSTVSVEKIARSENFYINAQGNVSIGTTQGLAKLQVNGTLLFPSLAGGTLTTDALGNVYVVSDPRLKTDVKPYTSGLKEILSIPSSAFITYKFKPESGLDTVNEYSGVDAKQLQAAIPEAVFEKHELVYTPTKYLKTVTGTDPFTKQSYSSVIEVTVPDTVGKDVVTLSVNDRPIIMAEAKAIQELNAKIEAQQLEIDNLTKRVEALEMKVGIMK
jgi:hypothetical protein